MISEFIVAASGLMSTTYGYGEFSCGDAKLKLSWLEQIAMQTNLNIKTKVILREKLPALASLSFHEFMTAHAIMGKLKPAQRCSRGAITASGEPFQPFDEPSAAIALPTNVIMRPSWVYLRIADGECHRVRVNDKMNPRFIGKRGFDLSPAAQSLLTGQPASRNWSARVFICEEPTQELLADLALE